MKKKFINLIVFISSALFSILLAEGIVRVFNLSYVLEHSYTDFFESADQIGFFGKKNTEGSWSTPEFKIKINHNSLGFRDDEYSLIKQRGIKRVVVLGDSYTWGWGVEKDEIYTERMESLLKNTDVINMGVPGYGISREYLILKEYALKFNPDLVIISFFLDDFLTSELVVKKESEWKSYKPNPFKKPDSYRVMRANYSDVHNYRLYYSSMVSENFLNWGISTIRSSLITSQKNLRANSALYNFTANKIKTTSKLEWARDILKKYGLMKKLPEVSIVASRTINRKDSWHYTKKAIMELKSISKDQNFKLMFIIIPEKAQVYKKFWPSILSQYNISLDDLDSPNRFIKQICLENNIHVLDLLPEFRKHADKGENLYFNYDPHWNPRGHEVAGELIYDYIYSNISL